MALTITKTYRANVAPSATDLDNAFNSIETKFNTTRIDSSEIASSAITAAKLDANSVTSSALENNVSVAGTVTVQASSVLSASAVKRLKADSSMVVVSQNTSGNQLKITCGFFRIGHDSQLLSSTIYNASVAYLDAHQWIVTFTTPFKSIPVVLCSQTGDEALPYSAIPHVSNVSTDSVTFYISGSPHIGGDGGIYFGSISFIALGERA